MKKTEYTPCGWMVEFRRRSSKTKRWESWKLDIVSRTKWYPHIVVKKWGAAGEQARLVRIYRKIEDD